MPNTSPDRIGQLLDQQDHANFAVFLGALLIVMSGAIGGISHQDLFTGTWYLSALAAAEGGVGFLVLIYGAARKHLVEKELEAAEPKQTATAKAAGAH